MTSAPVDETDGVPFTELVYGTPYLPKTPMDWTWSKPPSPTNSSSELVHRSGLIPGLIAASLFIMFLLCLYAILWKCMVSQAHRNAKRYRKKRTTSIHQKPVYTV